MTQVAFVGPMIDARTADSTPTAAIVRVLVSYVDTAGRTNTLPIEATVDVSDSISNVQEAITQAVIDAGPSVGAGYTLNSNDVVQL